MTRLLYRCDVQRNVAQPGRNRLNHPVKALTTVLLGDTMQLSQTNSSRRPDSSENRCRALPIRACSECGCARTLLSCKVIASVLVEDRDGADIFEDLDVLLVARRRTHRELLLRRIDTADVAQGQT